MKTIKTVIKEEFTLDMLEQITYSDSVNFSNLIYIGEQEYTQNGEKKKGYVIMLSKEEEGVVVLHLPDALANLMRFQFEGGKRQIQLRLKQLEVEHDRLLGRTTQVN